MTEWMVTQYNQLKLQKQHGKGGVMYQKILVPLDSSELAECVLPHLETIVKGCGVKEVTLVRVLEPFHIPGGAEGGGVFTDDEVKEIDARRKKELKAYLNRLVSLIDTGMVQIRSRLLARRLFSLEKSSGWVKNRKVNSPDNI